MQSETGNLYEHMMEYVAGQIAQEQDLQKLDQHGQNKQEQTTGEEGTDQQQMIEDTEREQ